MIIPKEISPETLTRMKKIDSMHGAQKPFLLKANIDRRTFKEALRKGYAWEKVVERIEMAIATPDKTPDPETIELVISTYYGTDPETLLVPSRNKRNLVEARQITFLLEIELGKMKPKAIAPRFGYADHSGVTNAIKALRRRLDSQLEDELKKRLSTIKQKVLAAC